MILPGMRMAILIGWLTSVIILVKPWGIPKFQWLCLPILLGAIYLPFFCLVNVDLIYNYHYYYNSSNANVSVSLNSTSGTKVKTGRLDLEDIVTTFLFIELLASNIIMRLIFLWHARKIADLLTRFRLYNDSRHGRQGIEGSSLSSPTSYIDLIITYTVYISTYAVVVLEGVDSYCYDKLKSTIREYIGGLTYSILISGLFFLPMMIPLKCAFSVIIASCGYLSIIFQDYCQHVLDTISERKYKGLSILSMEETEDASDEVKARRNIKNTIAPFSNELRLKLLGRFDIVQNVFELAHTIISPLALVLLGGSSIAVVLKAYEVTVLTKRPWVFLVRDSCHIINYLCFFWILQSGQGITDMISKCKAKLEEKYVELSEDTHFMERETLRNILSLIKYWDWKFTACEFFVIDRSLASGVVSIIMTYVVVLVQLKVQEEPDTIASTEDSSQS